jgi:hypothetical protein
MRARHLTDLFKARVAIEANQPEKIERVPVTVWIPAPHKEIFDRGQRVTNKHLGKDIQAGLCDFLQELLPAIAEAEIKAEQERLEKLERARSR